MLFPMSRNLYTIAVVAPGVARDLYRLHRERRDDWLAGAGERLLAAETTTGDPRVAYYRVILDGWNHALAYLAQTRQFGASPTLHSLCDNAEHHGLAIVEPRNPLPRLKPPRPSRLLNGYAVRALAAALDDASTFMNATRCPAVLLKRTIGASIDDSAFNPPRWRSAVP
jgi:hypothetical protein